MHAHHQPASYQEGIRVSANLCLWTLACVATLALARFGPSYLWDHQPVAGWGAVAANVAVGIGWIVAHASYLRGIDELQRKIMQDALAATLGVGWVCGFAYVVADAAGLISFDASIGLFAVLLAVVYVVAIVVGHLKYR